MLNKRLMIVIDIADMPERIGECVQGVYQRSGGIDCGTAVSFIVPAEETVATDGYSSKDEQQVCEYLMSEGIKLGTELFIYRDW